MILNSRRWADWLGECPLGATRSSTARDVAPKRSSSDCSRRTERSAARLESADQVGQVPRQDPAQPGDQLRLGLALELVEVLVGLEQRFLDQVGGVRLAPQRGVDAGAGQQPQVVAIRLQQPVEGARGLAPRLLDQPNDDGIPVDHGRSLPGPVLPGSAHDTTLA